jgi:hypothetical protein
MYFPQLLAEKYFFTGKYFCRAGTPKIFFWDFFFEVDFWGTIYIVFFFFFFMFPIPMVPEKINIFVENTEYDFLDFWIFCLYRFSRFSDFFFEGWKYFAMFVVFFGWDYMRENMLKGNKT